jgi:dolichyl-phosphate beta-glucosyltransferase
VAANGDAAAGRGGGPVSAAAVPLFSVVIPAYNEEAAIAVTVGRLSRYLASTALSWEIIVVDDGSADATVSIVEALAAANVHVRLVRAGRHGKGAAVRRGMLEAVGTWRFMADADLSMPPENLARFFAALKRADPAPHVLIGSREAPGSERVGEPWRRHVVGRAFNLLVQMVVLPGIHDSQCGFKLFSAEAVRALFPRTTIDGFAFDVEVLTLARRAGYGVCEVGIEWHCRPDSRVSVWRGAAAFADVLRVRWNAWSRRYRGIPAPAAGPAELERVCC